MKNSVKKIIPSSFLSFYHYLFAFFGAFLYGFPGYSKRIKIIGVTGTSGKSTTVDLITRVLEEDDLLVASISTVRFRIDGKTWENKLKMTMPGRLKIHKFLREAIKSGCQFAVLEVSSEGIRQFRHRFMNFDCAVFTNLTPEHVESHKGFENYRREKLKLFYEAKNIHVINIDDENSKYFFDIPAEKKYAFGIKNRDPRFKAIFAEGIRQEDSRLLFEIRSAREREKFQTHLMGEFNVYNSLAAVAVGLAYEIPFGTCKRAIEKAEQIPGRMEAVTISPFRVIVDYAHTPEQLESVYKALSETSYRGEANRQTQNSRLICVLGSCGGGRDKWKRPVLGKIAGKYCDKAIITDEDPYDENPMEIINQVASGAGGKSEKILDREKAISIAIKAAKTGDTVIITGKGSEPWMCVANGKKIPWSDRRIAEEELKKNKPV